MGEPIEFVNQSIDSAQNPISHYYLDLGDGTILDSAGFQTINHTYAVADTYTVFLAVENLFGCADTLRRTVIVNQLPSASLVAFPDSNCISTRLLLQLQSRDADSVWIDFGDGTSAFIDSFWFHQYPNTGTFLPTLYLKDTTLCDANYIMPDSIYAGIPARALFNFSTDTNLCIYDSSYLINHSTLTDFGGLNSQFDSLQVWINGSIMNTDINLDSLLITFSVDGTYEVTLIVFDDFLCSDTLKETILVHPTPTVEAGNDTITCPGFPVPLFGDNSLGGIDFDWQPSRFLDDRTIANPTAIVEETTTFYLTYSSRYCFAQDSVIVNVFDSLNLTAWPDTQVCRGLQVQLHSSYNTDLPELNYQWEPFSGLDDPFILDPIASPQVATTYCISASCGLLADEACVDLAMLEPPAVNIIEDTIYTIRGNTVEIKSTASGLQPFQFEWTPPDYLSCTNCQNTSSIPDEEIKYYLRLTDVNGCQDIDSVVIIFMEGCIDGAHLTGRAFTPNGDGINDYFHVKRELLTKLDYLRVYNRWGEQVFSTTDINEGWDGRHRGKMSNPDVFSYLLKGVCIDRRAVLLTGNVTLIR